jgi:predicted transcriptional regulator
MSTVSLRIPEYLHEQVRLLAEREKVSINQLITLAVAEKVAVLIAEDRIRERAKKASRGRFERALARVPDVEPHKADKFPKT